jgi:hypothetical protein
MTRLEMPVVFSPRQPDWYRGHNGLKPRLRMLWYKIRGPQWAIGPLYAVQARQIRGTVHTTLWG